MGDQGGESGGGERERGGGGKERGDKGWGWKVVERDYQIPCISIIYSSVTIEIYDRITSTRARHIISCFVNSATIRLFFTVNHYDSLLSKNLHEQSLGVFEKFKKIKSSEFKKKNENHIIIERMKISLLMKSLMIVLKNISNQ